MTHQIEKPTQKIQDIKKKCFLIGKFNLRKIQLTRDLRDETILCQGIHLPCKNDQRYCDPTTRTQATIV